MRAGVAALAVLVGCLGEAEPSEPAAALSADDALATCVAGDAAGGVAGLAQAVGDPDALVARGLCRWILWAETDDAGQARAAYLDLTAAMEAVERGVPARAPLDEIVSRRAFVARALDGAWVRTLEDLDRAVALAPDAPTHALDRAVVRRYAGDDAGARAELERFLALADSTDTDRRALARSLLAELPAAVDTAAVDTAGVDTAGAARPTGP